jgi:PAS domain S-box-containing protein
MINRSMDKWFSYPANEMVRNARDIGSKYVAGEQDDLQKNAVTFAKLVGGSTRENLVQTLANELKQQDLLALAVYDANGSLIAQSTTEDINSFPPGFQKAWQEARANAQQNPSESVDADHRIYLVASAPIAGGGALVAGQLVPPEIAQRALMIERQDTEYDQLKRKQTLLKNNFFMLLALLTLLIIFIATWLALYVARGFAGPVQELAQATQRIKSGDLSYRAEVIGDDELALLAVSFNEMTAEMAETRSDLERSASALRETNSALEERRRYIEVVLQSLSAGVISLDEQNRVTTINPAAQRMLRLTGPRTTGGALESLLPDDQRDELRRLVRRAARLRSVSREVHFTLANNARLDAGVTVTALHDPQGEWRGTVIVIEDLTDLIVAQRRAAWSEVARRMAHEIKNPLTPIRLSAERLAKKLLSGGNGRKALDAGQSELVRECTAMIGTEVATLQRMVDEFSSFARLPSAKLASSQINEIVASALKLYDERLDGIRLYQKLGTSLPAVLVDAEQIKRVIVNLIDNSAEALAEVRGERCITVETLVDQERETVELVVSDNGPGIRASDRERVFDPYFSTRKRGTGLGLAIVSHIVAEHQARIRVEENLPQGARFTVELPIAA